MSSSHVSKLKKIRKDILRAAHYSKEGHVASSFSVLETVYAVYVLLPPRQIFNPLKSDFFILSKAHASLALFAVLSEVNVLEEDWFRKFCKVDSNLGGHPDRLKIKEVVASTGSLGHGLPIAVGISLAQKALNSESRVMVLVGDGELNEGSNWESLLVAEHHKLSNLILIIDFNNSTNRSTSLGDLSSKLKSFGLTVFCVDGHNLTELTQTFEKIKESDRVAIIIETIKGKGIKEMENNPEWHHKSPNSDLMDKFILELES